MRISWLLLADNAAMNEHSQKLDILGECRRVAAERIPYVLSRFYIISRAEVDARDIATIPYKLTMRLPSDEIDELHNSDVCVAFPPKAGHVIGALIVEIRNLEFTSQGRRLISAQLGDSKCTTDITVMPQRNVANDGQE